MDMDVSQYEVASQLLLNLGKVMPRKDFADLRLVCSIWNAIIGNTPNLLKSRIRFTQKQWDTKALSTVQYHNAVTKWQSALIQNASLINNKGFQEFWKVSCQNIGKLELNNLQVRCVDLTHFLEHLCPHVHDVNLDMMHYIKSPMIDAQNRNGDWQWVYTVCDHEVVRHGAVPGIAINIKPTITALRITTNFIIPTCLLDILTVKSSGCLKKLAYVNAKMPRYHRASYYPTEATVYNKLMSLVRASELTLKTIEWSKNVNGHGFFNALTAHVRATPPLQDPVLQLRSLEFREYQRLYQGVPTSLEPAINFIRIQAAFIQELTLHQGTRDVLLDTLPEWLPDLTELKSFRLTLLHSRVVGGIDLSTIDTLTKLEKVHIVVKSGRIHAPPILSTSYTQVLPTQFMDTVRLSHPALRNGHFVRTIGRLTTAPNMVHLILESANDFADNGMQTLIRSLPQLKKLVVTPCTCIHDIGVTGLNKDTIAELHATKTHQWLDGIEPDPPQGHDNYGHARVNLRRLQDLEVLALHASKLTDISVFASFYFPKLRVLDISSCQISDAGLVHIAKNCPNLETLILLEMSNCTYHGLNALIFAARKLTTIFVGHMTANRLLMPDLFSRYYVHPDYKRIVKVDCPSNLSFAYLL